MQQSPQLHTTNQADLVDLLYQVKGHGMLISHVG